MAGEQGAAGAQIDMAAIQKTVNETLAGALKPLNDAIAGLAGSQKTIADALAAQATATQQQQPGKDNKPEPLTAESATKIFTDLLTKHTQAQQQTAQTQQQRDQFIATNLAKLPDAYKAQLGNDSSKWADEAKNIQAKFETDFKGLGGKLETIGGATRDGGTPAGAEKVDISKLNPVQKIAMGLKTLPNGAGGAAQATQATTTGATAAA